MGGLGSGRRAEKTTVEECLILSAGTMQRKKMLRAGVNYSSMLVWTRVSTGEELSKVGFELDTLNPARPTIRLFYDRISTGDHLDYTIGLTTTALPWRGVRWWFICPLSINGRSCQRRCDKLYLPPGGAYFGCRQCYRLTYQSCRDSHRFDRLYDQLTDDLGAISDLVKDLSKE